MIVKELIDYLNNCHLDYPVLIEGMDCIGGVTEERDLVEPDKSHVALWCGS